MRPAHPIGAAAAEQALRDAAGACRDAHHAQLVIRSCSTARVSCLGAAVSSSDDSADVVDGDDTHPEHGTASASSDDGEDSSMPELPLGALRPGAALRASTDAAGAAAGAATHFEVGRLARLSNGACVARRGGTQVLATVACNAGSGGFRQPGLMLQVDYRQRLHASGRMPGNFFKTEGQPSGEELVAGRAVDAALRPLFPPSFPFDLQVSVNVQSVDQRHDPAVLAINAASAAVATSPVQWAGPIAAVVATVSADGAVEVDAAPPAADGAAPALRLLVVGSRHGILLLEAEGSDATEEDFAKALSASEPAVRALVAAQEILAADAQVAKMPFEDDSADPVAVDVVAQHAEQAVHDAVRSTEGGKAGRAQRLHDIKSDLIAQLQGTGRWRFGHSRVRGSGCVTSGDLDAALAQLTSTAVRALALREGRRADGRGLTDLRPLYCEVGAVEMVHGSALFQRGETQVLAAATVAATEARDASQGAPNLYVQYSSPPWANNEVALRFGSQRQKRREAGHSELVRRALQPALPPASPDYPWTVRLNADTLASNGSSSMAAVCAGSLALHAASLPVHALTAGVSVGLLSPAPAPSPWPAEPSTDAASAPGDGGGGGGGGDWFGAGSGGAEAACVLPHGQELLVDLQGLEDAVGDMDFKVAGTRTGITAARLDVKTRGVSAATVVAALRAARAAHAEVLSAMEGAIAAAGPPQARLGQVTIESAQIGRFIGPNGTTVKAVQAATGAQYQVCDSGRISVYAPGDGLPAALDAVQNTLGGNIKAGQRYRARVVRLMDYGAFVELDGTGGTQALVHISEMAVERVRSVEDVVSEGDEVEVLVVGHDARKNIRLSMKALRQQDGQAAGGRNSVARVNNSGRTV